MEDPKEVTADPTNSSLKMKEDMPDPKEDMEDLKEGMKDLKEDTEDPKDPTKALTSLLDLINPLDLTNLLDLTLLPETPVESLEASTVLLELSEGLLEVNGKATLMLPTPLPSETDSDLTLLPRPQ